MSHFEFHLNRRFWRSKKVVQVVQIRGRGGGEVIWTKSKRRATFFREILPYPHPHCPHHMLSCKNPYKVVCHGDTRVAPSKDGEDPYAEPKARGMFIKVEIVDRYESGFHLGCG